MVEHGVYAVFGRVWRASARAMPALIASIALVSYGSSTFVSEACGQESYQWYGFRPLGSTIRALAIDPSDSQVIYAGTEGGWVSKSTNGGVSWTTASLGVGSQVTAVATDPSAPSTVYAATVPTISCRLSLAEPTWR
jgi:hypothetical protein